eukprot:936303-Prymnesium_polylepis.1
MAYRFQYAGWAGIVQRNTGEEQSRGATAIKELAVLFGEKAAWSPRAIKDAVTAGKDSPGEAAS